MSNFDLNIQNYTINDIEKFFKLDQTQYTKSDIELKEYEMRSLLLQNKSLSKSLKRDVIVFCTAAKQWLLFSKFGERSIMASNNEHNISDNDDFQRPPSTFRNTNNKTGFETNKQIPQVLSQEISRKENELIYNDGKPYVFVDNSEFHKGQMNPLNSRVIKKCISIDTKHRDKYDTTESSDFFIQLPSKINNVVSMQLSNFEIPITFYNISSCYGNNYVWLKIDTQYYVGGPVEPYSAYVVLPDGMYSATSLIATLNDLLSPRDNSGILLNPDSPFNYINFYLFL